MRAVRSLVNGNPLITKGWYIMKQTKYFLCALIVLIISFGTSCSQTEATPLSRTQRDLETKQAIINSQLGEYDTIILEKSLKAGSVLLCCRRAYEDDPYWDDFNNYAALLGAYDGHGGYWTTFVSPFDTSLPIFNDYSLAFAWESYNGTDILFYISPVGEVPTSYDVPYAESSWYGITPYDSIGTEPILLCDEDVLDGYPTWIFCTTKEDLPEDYELHYGDQVVTYDDLRDWLSDVHDYMPKK